jgi:hypothetical protein
MSIISITPEQSFLQECFDYDPDSGSVFWKSRPESHFKNLSIAKMWNTRFSGLEITGSDPLKYIAVKISDKTYPLHRVLFKLHYGIEPKEFLLHENFNRTDNRIDNFVNSDTKKPPNRRMKPSTNTSGLLGAVYRKASKKWTASITINGIDTHLGTFDTAEEANQAYINATIV